MRIFICLTILKLLIGSAWADTYKSGNNLPEIGANHQNVLSREREQQMGASFFRQLNQHDLVINDPSISAYIQNLGNRLRAGIDADTKLKFFVLPDRRINAFATPGGYIGVNSGLILATASEDELAGVMAHEIAHVSQRHIARFYQNASQGAWAQLGAMLGAIALAASGETQGATALIYAGAAARYQSLISHTREHEQEADRTGINYLAQAGYDPIGMALFFEKLQARNLQDDMSFEFLRTHPLTNNRIAEAKERANKINAANKTALHHNPRPSALEYQLIKARLKTIGNNNHGQLLANYQRQLSAKNGNLAALSIADNYSRALLFINQGNYSQAQSAIKYLLTQYPEQKQFLLELARIDFLQKKYSQARRQLAQLHELYPQDIAIASAYIKTLLASQQSQIALQTIDSLDAIWREQASIIHMRAQALQQNGQDSAYKICISEYFFAIGNLKAAQLQIDAALKTKLNSKQSQRARELQQAIQQERQELSRQS